jgi:hypothetical protein
VREADIGGGGVIRFGAAVGLLTLLLGAARAEEPSVGCPYLRLALSTPITAPNDPLQARYREGFAEELRRAGFEVTGPTSQPFGWEAYTQVRSIGSGQLIWSFAFLPMPGVSDGAVRFSTFSRVTRGGRVEFNSTHYLKAFPVTDFPIQVVLAADQLAQLYLPSAVQRCSDLAKTLEAEEARLERIRESLSEEIIRVRRARAAQEKRLELEVER